MPAQTKTTPAPQASTGFFSSPSDLVQAATEANRTVNSIDGAVQAAAGSTSAAPSNWVDSWDSFKLVFSTWYQKNFGSGSHVDLEWLTTDLQGQLQNYQGQIASWASQANGYGISVPGGVAQPSSSNPFDFLPSGGVILGGLALLAVVVISWKVL